MASKQALKQVLNSKPTAAASKRAKKALVLVAVLWVVVLLVVIVAALARDSMLDTRICLSGGELLRAKWALRGGTENAIALLLEDTKESDSLADNWSSSTNIALEGCQVSVQIIDEASKLNINTATREQLLRLPDMTEEIADAIIDWRDQDDTPSQAGVETGYYLNLPFGYRIRNGPFRTIRELLLVKGITTELLYGKDTNQNSQLDSTEKDADRGPLPNNTAGVVDAGWLSYLTCYSRDNNTDALGNNRVNINKAGEQELAQSLSIPRSRAKWIVENRKNSNYKSIADLINENSPEKPKQTAGRASDAAEPLDMETFYSIADRLTISDEKKITGLVNLNTAAREVLAALLGDETLAHNIVAYRQALSAGMQSIAEVMQADGIGTDAFKKLANYVTIRSDIFAVSCRATSDLTAATYKAEAVLDRSQSPAVILYWYCGAEYCAGQNEKGGSAASSL